MFSLDQLVAFVAQIEALSESFVVGVATALCDAGLMSRRKRCQNSAVLSVRDVANLLIGVNAAPDARDAPKIVQWHRGMVNYMRSPQFHELGGNDAERRTVGQLAFIAENLATFGEVLDRLLLMAADGSLRRLLHDVGLLQMTTPDLWLSTFDSKCKHSRQMARTVLESGDVDELAVLRHQHRRELEELIRLSASSLLIRFGRPFPFARIELRCGDRTSSGPPSGGACLLAASFEVDFDDDLVIADSDHLHEVRRIARSEVVTIDQRALLAAGELLAGKIQLDRVRGVGLSASSATKTKGARQKTRKQLNGADLSKAPLRFWGV